jgi:transcriptional regulator with XRE-family HTH domain
MKRARDPGQVLRAIEARDLTRREVARLAGCSVGTVENMLAGRPLNPTLARRVARSLRRGVDELFTDAASNNEQLSGDEEAVA